MALLSKTAASTRWGCADGMEIELSSVEISGQTLFSFFHPEKLCTAMLQGILFIQCSCCMNLFCLRPVLWFALDGLFQWRLLRSKSTVIGDRSISLFSIGGLL